MKFWDSSAIVPLVIGEPQSTLVRRWHEKDDDMMVWALAVTEVHSSLNRKRREGRVTKDELLAAIQRLQVLEKGWSEVIHLEKVRRRAHRLLAIHTLRAADALQLAAALIAVEETPESKAFLTFDQNLALAAAREGFEVPA